MESIKNIFKKNFTLFFGVLSFPNPIYYDEARLSPEQPRSRGQEPEEASTSLECSMVSIAVCHHQGLTWGFLAIQMPLKFSVH